MEYLSELERQYTQGQEPYALVSYELLQAQETGHDVSALRERAKGLTFTGADDAELTMLYAKVPLSPRAGWPYFEASEFAAIEATLPAADDQPVEAGADLESRIRAAWYGRVAGNMLGKPIEFPWPREQVRAYLEARDAYPLRDYVPIGPRELASLAEHGFLGEGYLDYEALSRGGIDGGVRDDDIDYTILGLHLLETYGEELTAWDVAREWLIRLPVYQTYTAERATYQNLVREVPLEAVGEFHNPYREYIGALIRADIFGYVFPGSPRRAALLSYRDAALSHRANGIYGEMWAAALVSTAFTADSPEASIRASLEHVPPTSRLAEEISTVVADHEAGRGWEEAIDDLELRYPAMSGAHTINNGGALTAAILWGDGDFSATVGYAAQAGLDADSIGATAGSWAGAFLGEQAIPARWIEPLHGRTRSAIFGFSEVALDEMAERTLDLVARFR